MPLLNWEAEYKEKIVTAEEAAKCVKSGDWNDPAVIMWR